jgi:hypothetical protein
MGSWQGSIRMRALVEDARQMKPVLGDEGRA